MKLGCSIVRAAGLHLLAITVHDKMEEEVETSTATFDNRLQHCEDLNATCGKEDEFSEITITLV